ncbi:MAG: hypothetical protein AVDCRST_MAG90-2997 [uncultured Microvirga sp.]|uniref:Uncharacterized protein n=1 Tax=uncultured Microvirga sp. TaxID=412392 RepID=A0A6J4MKH6_9HYPH|nr:MAG: hypothetical protein AVDCRST_MAG90-2997 [uncultured Microvirga sp.]
MIAVTFVGRFKRATLPAARSFALSHGPALLKRDLPPPRPVIPAAPEPKVTDPAVI